MVRITDKKVQNLQSIGIEMREDLENSMTSCEEIIRMSGGKIFTKDPKS